MVIFLLSPLKRERATTIAIAITIPTDVPQGNKSVNKNIIGAPKILNNFGANSNWYFSIDPHLVIALSTLW